MLAARRSLSHWPHVTRKREVRVLYLCVYPLLLSFSLSASLPLSLSLAPSLPLALYSSLLVSVPRHFRQLRPRRGRRPRGKEESRHSRDRALFESARALVSRAGILANSAGNVERESGIAVAPPLLPFRPLHSLFFSTSSSFSFELHYGAASPSPSHPRFSL